MSHLKGLILLPLALLFISGCTVYTAQSTRPPVRVEMRPAAPYATAAWMDGHWKWNRWRHEWVWVPGHWVVKHHHRW